MYLLGEYLPLDCTKQSLKLIVSCKFVRFNLNLNQYKNKCRVLITLILAFNLLFIISYFTKINKPIINCNYIIFTNIPVLGSFSTVIK